MTSDPETPPAALADPREWWTLGEALAWIAFKERLPFERRQEAQSLRPSRDWGPRIRIEDEFLAGALAARAHTLAAPERKHVWQPWGPWEPGKEPPLPLRYYRATARRLVREPGFSEEWTASRAQDMALLARADAIRIAKAEERWERAERDLRAALAAERLSAWGRQVFRIGDLPVNKRDRIERTHLFRMGMEIVPAEGDAPPFFGGCVTNDVEPITFVDVRLDGGEVRVMWPKVSKTREARVAAAREWMQRQIPAAIALGLRWKRKLAIPQCARDTQCTEPVAKEAWDELSGDLKNPRGRPRKAAFRK